MVVYVMAMLHVIITLVLYVSEAAVAKKVTIKCEPPKGQTIILPKIKSMSGEIKVQRSPDGYLGTEPIFVMDLENSSKILVLWGKNIPEQDSKKADDSALPATEATILRASSQMVTALESFGDSVIWMYTFYPQENLGYFTRHRHEPSAGSSASHFFSKCSFTPSK